MMTQTTARRKEKLPAATMVPYGVGSLESLLYTVS
jgi:hypothetical protein